MIIKISIEKVYIKKSNFVLAEMWKLSIFIHSNFSFFRLEWVIKNKWSFSLTKISHHKYILYICIFSRSYERFTLSRFTISAIMSAIIVKFSEAALKDATITSPCAVHRHWSTVILNIKVMWIICDTRNSMKAVNVLSDWLRLSLL